jgi:GntR family transcriptional regulator / MocR family aminotransferase
MTRERPERPGVAPLRVARGSRAAGVSLQEQIHRQLLARIESGLLAPGARLPASRVLARELGVARITVELAIGRLQAAGLVIRRVGSGTVVAGG